MLVSVVIPTYKRSKETLKRAIDSVLGQTYKKIEVIVIDDSPNSFEGRIDVEEYVNSLKERNVHLIKHEHNMGANVARNTGIINASGDFIAFLDDDDEWYSEKIERQLKLFSNENIGLVYCSAEEITIRNNTVKKVNIRKAKYRGSLHEKLYQGNLIGSTSATIIRKSVFEQTGMFDINLESAQDYEMYLRVSKKFLIDYADGPPLIKYYRHDGEKISGNGEKAIRSRNYIQEKYSDFIFNNATAHNYFFLNKAKYFIQTGDIYKSFKCWKDGTLSKPLNIKYNLKVLKDISLLGTKYFVKKKMLNGKY